MVMLNNVYNKLTHNGLLTNHINKHEMKLEMPA